MSAGTMSVRSCGVRVICHPEAGTGFLLAGLETLEVSVAGDAARRLTSLAEQADVGVVLVQDDLYDALGAEFVHEFGRRVLPMVIPFPGPATGVLLSGAEEYIVEMLRQAIGYRVRLR